MCGGNTKQNLGRLSEKLIRRYVTRENEVIVIRLQMIAATHAMKTHSTVVGVDEIRKDIVVFVQHPTLTIDTAVIIEMTVHSGISALTVPD